MMKELDYGDLIAQVSTRAVKAGYVSSVSDFEFVVLVLFRISIFEFRIYTVYIYL